MNMNSAKERLRYAIQADLMAKNAREELITRFEPFYDWYIGATTTERSFVGEGLSDEECQSLGVICEELTVHSWQKGVPKYLKMALVALGVEDARHDYRYTYGRAAMINHVADRLGMSADDLFVEAESIAGSEVRRHLSSFRRSSPKARSIEAQSFREIHTDRGPDFEYFEKPFPSETWKR